MVSNGVTRAVGRTEDVHAAIGCLQRLADAFHVRRGQLAATVGLTDHQWGVLEEIATEHFMPSMFARRRQSSAAAVSKTLRQLGDKGRGFIDVSVDPQDARQRQYVLTARGKRVMEKLRASRQDAIDHIWADLDAADLGMFIRFGSDLTRRLEEYAGRSDSVETVSDGTGKRSRNRERNNEARKQSGVRQEKKSNGKDPVRQGV